MQVDRKPNRWPFVGALIGLLIVCLSLPRYWQSCQKRNEIPSTLAFNLTDEDAAQWTPAEVVEPQAIDPLSERATGILGQVGTLDPSVPAGIMPVLEHKNELLSLPYLQSTPTIDELISMLNRGLGMTPSNIQAIDLPDTTTTYSLVPYARIAPPNTETIYGRPVAQLIVPSPEVVEAMRAFGEWWVTQTKPQSKIEWLNQAAEAYRNWTTQEGIAAGETPVPAEEEAVPADGPMASLPVTSSNDRLAMLPPQANIGPIEQDEVGEPVATEPARETAVVQQDNSSWTPPRTLLNQLTRLAQHPYSAHWANDTIWELEAMSGRDHSSAYDVTTGLANLTRDAEKAFELAQQTQDDQLRAELLRAHWGLARRLDCWKLMHEIHIASLSNGRLAARGSFKPLFADPPVLMVGPESQSINAAIESYEQTGDPKTGREVVVAQQELMTSDEPLDQALAESIEQHYRNANIRIAITGAMLNRFVSSERSESRMVCERIAGTPVRGHAETTSENRVKLLPATGQWQMDLEADGIVDSTTLADGGVAQIRSHGATEFTASKSITIDPTGVHMAATSVRANNNNRPTGVSSDYDWMPVVGDVIRTRAMDQYHAKRGRAKSEVEYKVAARAMKTLDRESGRMVDEMRDQVHHQLLDPLRESGVELTTVELTSTPERLVARMRIAGNKQIGAHTPRPRAPADSLASLQIHESAMTNSAVSLGLDNRRYTAEELQATLRDRLPRLAMSKPVEARPNTAFQFADQDSVQFHMNQGRMELTVGLAMFEQEGRRIGPVVVHAFYKPAVDGLKAELVRDGGLGIEGRVSVGDRAVLHNVFKEVFAEDRRLPIVQLDNPEDQRLAGLMITQLVMEDGWLGIAVGPTANGRVAERSRSLR